MAGALFWLIFIGIVFFGVIYERSGIEKADKKGVGTFIMMILIILGVGVFIYAVWPESDPLSIPNSYYPDDAENCVGPYCL